MALYAIGDLHLSFTVNKPMEVFGAEWKNHVARIEKHWKKRVAPEDTVVVTGDHSGGRTWRSAPRTWNLSPPFRGRRFCCGGTTICSGTPKRPTG